MDEMDEFREMFFVECDELLEGLANDQSSQASRGFAWTVAAASPATIATSDFRCGLAGSRLPIEP